MSMPLSKKHMVRTAGWLYSNGDIHAGYDYKVSIGTPVFAVRDGHILAMRDTIKNMDPDEDGVTGDPPNFIMQAIRYKGEKATVVYMHISPNAKVKQGDEIRAGDQLALSGHNGHSTGPHLHISVMKGHHTDPFDYLDGLEDKSKAPRGVAPNGVTMFPPSLVYSGEPLGEYAKGKVFVKELEFGQMDSDSVRRLQHRLNAIPIDGGQMLPVTGNYLDMTKAEVALWQVQRRGAKKGSREASGNIEARQAQALFGKRYEVITPA